MLQNEVSDLFLSDLFQLLDCRSQPKRANWGYLRLKDVESNVLQPAQAVAAQEVCLRGWINNMMLHDLCKFSNNDNIWYSISNQKKCYNHCEFSIRKRLDLRIFQGALERVPWQLHQSWLTRGRVLAQIWAFCWFLLLKPYKKIDHKLPIWGQRCLTNIMGPFFAQEVEETYPQEYWCGSSQGREGDRPRWWHSYPWEWMVAGSLCQLQHAKGTKGTRVQKGDTDHHWQAQVV